MKSRKRKPGRKRTTPSKRPARKTARRRHPQKRRIVKRNRVRRTSTVALNPREADLQRRVFRVLRRMLQDHDSLSKASRTEGIKSETVVRRARPALRRSGHGKAMEGNPRRSARGCDECSYRGSVICRRRSYTARVKEDCLSRCNQALKDVKSGRGWRDPLPSRLFAV